MPPLSKVALRRAQSGVGFVRRVRLSWFSSGSCWQSPGLVRDGIRGHFKRRVAVRHLSGRDFFAKAPGDRDTPRSSGAPAAGMSEARLSIGGSLDRSVTLQETTLILSLLVVIALLTVWNTLRPYVKPTGSDDGNGVSTRSEVRRLAGEIGQQIQASRSEQSTRSVELQLLISDQMSRLEQKVIDLDRAVISGLGDVRTVNSAELEKIRTQNEQQLERMRLTVDEKLQGTLEQRLGESFKLVSRQLEQVQRGLGEMQNLATDVGGLKRVLTNVKNRGTWGEVQLARQLEDVLTPDQYAENVAVKPNANERVEFAVKLPGRNEDGPIYLPIDSKFPLTSYERLLEAQEAGERAQFKTAVNDLERAVITQAKMISEKYVFPPFTTDFAIMYLPTEGLFAEVIRIPGFVARVQQEHRVMITGPTTFGSLLSSLQMGFKTVAIEERTSEVWTVLAAAKAEFEKYGQVWVKLDKQLQTAQNTVQEAGRRTRAVERQLRDIENIEPITGTENSEVGQA